LKFPKFATALCTTWDPKGLIDSRMENWVQRDLKFAIDTAQRLGWLSPRRQMDNDYVSI